MSDESVTNREEDGDRPRRGLWRTMTLAGLAFALLFAVLSVYLLIHQSSDPCRRWEAQLGELSRGLTRHRLAEGAERRSTLAALEGLPITCAKVAEVRDRCVSAYRALLEAEAGQREAKAALARLGQVIGTLPEAQRELAQRRFLDGESRERIARELHISEAEVSTRLDLVIERLGASRLQELDRAIQDALDRSDEQVRRAKRDNDACDRGYKRLVEAAQSR